MSGSGVRIFEAGTNKPADDYDILIAYEIFLGRIPENSYVIQEKRGQPLARVIGGILSSAEFLELDARANSRADVSSSASDMSLDPEQIRWVADLLALPEAQDSALRNVTSRGELFRVLKWIGSGRALLNRSIPSRRVAGRETSRRVFALIDVDFPIPGEHLRPGAALSGKGWVIAEAEIEEIAVYLDETFLCYAYYGLPRSEVAARFPHYPQAEQCGFSFSATLAAAEDCSRPRTLVIAVRMANGAIVRKRIPLAPEPQVAAETEGAQTARSSELAPISIFVEHARIDAEGLLAARGWIASALPLADVRMFLGDVQLGRPELGMARPDVAASHPHYPNAANSGFELVQDVSAFPSSRCVLRITAECTGGVRRQIIMPIENGASQRQVLVQDSEIHLCCDSAMIRTDGAVSVSGWAVAEAGVRAVDVALDGRLIGAAETGLNRADVGNRFPRIPSARQSGFRFRRQLERRLRGEHVLSLTVRTCDGSEKPIELPLKAVSADAGELVVADVLGGAEEFRIEIDAPRLQGPRAAEPLRGALLVSGWAVVPGGLDSIGVQLDERQPLPAYVGVRREDVAANFPDNRDALFSGFALTIPHRAVGVGEHTVRVLVRAKSGRSAERAFQIVSENPDDAAAAIRSRLTQAEADLRHAVLRSTGRRPAFLLVVSAKSGSARDVQKLQATVDSLAQQAYADWRAVILLPPGHSPARVMAAVEQAGADLSGRVRVQTRARGGRRDALPWPASEQPQFLIVLSAGDRLDAGALLEFATANALDPAAEFIYADERCYDAATDTVQPWLKPDWSPDLLLSMNYIGRVWCAAREIVERARFGTDDLATRGEYDAVLRLTEQAASVVHAPLLLCERAERRLDSSELERRALERAAERRGWQAEVLQGRAAGTWRMRRALESAGLVSVVMPTCAARGLVETAIRSLHDRTGYPHVEIVAIDNIPREEQEWKSWLRRHADRVVEIGEPFNWSRFNNAGARAARGEFLLFLNDDIEIRDPGWLAALLEYAERPEIGVVGPQLLYPDGKVQHAGMFLADGVGRHAFRFAPGGEPGAFGQALAPRNVIAVTGACMLMRRATFEALGGFDEAHGVTNNDVDFCLRCWSNGLRVVWTPFASLVHHELASRGKLADSFDQAAFRAAWGRRLAKGDPFLNPGLRSDVDDYLPDSEPVELLYGGSPLLARERVKRILALKLDHIGDFVTALPAFRHLKDRFPEAELTVLAPEASRHVAALEPAIDRWLAFDFFNSRSELGQRRIEEAELRDLQTRLAAYRFDVAVDFRMQTETRYVLRYTGAGVLAGFDHAGLFPWLDVAVEWEGDVRLQPKRAHVSDRLLALVDAVDRACGSPPSVLPSAPAAAEALARLRGLAAAREAPRGFFDKPLVCVHAGVGNVMRQWPAESYAALIDLLIAEEGVHVLLVGGADEAPIAREIMAAVSSPAVLSLVGGLSLAELPIVMRACALFVGNNSGPKHIAAALGVPTVGVHSGNVDAVEWAPRGPYAVAVRRRVVCGPCYLATPAECHRNLFCLRGIRPADVYRACRLLLRLRLAPGVAKPASGRVSPPVARAPAQGKPSRTRGRPLVA